MEPVGVLLASALFIGAKIARKPADEIADLVWVRIKKALLKTIGKEPTAADLTEPAMQMALARSPEIRADLESIFGRFSALRRAQIAASALRGARVLWIDDHPENNSWERRLLDALGVTCVSVETTRSATACLTQETFDLIISDIARGGNANEGIESLPAIRGVARNIPLLFYVGQRTSQALPTEAQGLADEPNELLHLVLDQLERSRL